jgi:CheY-like chemotaxis protein
VTPLHDYMNGLPVIAVSAATNRARDHYVLELAKTVGATVTISKPVSDGEWIELVTEHLANRAQ